MRRMLSLFRQNISDFEGRASQRRNHSISTIASSVSYNHCIFRYRPRPWYYGVCDLPDSVGLENRWILRIWNQRISQPKANPTQAKTAKNGQNSTSNQFVFLNFRVALGYGVRWISCQHLFLRTIFFSEFSWGWVVAHGLCWHSLVFTKRYTSKWQVFQSNPTQ